MQKVKIGIIGLGLIGGSIFKALRRKNYDVCAVSKSQKGKNISKNIESLKDCKIVFVCSPMSETQSALDNLNKFLTTDTIVSDVSSVKNFLKGKKYNFNFISTHPMAGTEFSGFNASFADLFKGAKWVISKNNKILEKIIKDMGAKPVLADFKEHDTSVALISHMPALLSYALFDATKDNELALKLASSGFRDMTRLASINSTLTLDMLELNKKNIDEAVKKLTNSLKKIKSMNRSEKTAFIEEIAQQRRKMYDKNGKNNK